MNSETTDSGEMEHDDAVTPAAPVDPALLVTEPMTEGPHAITEQALVTDGYDIVGVYLASYMEGGRADLTRYSEDLGQIVDDGVDWVDRKRGHEVHVLWKRVRPAPQEQPPDGPDGYTLEDVFTPPFSFADLDDDDPEPMIAELMRRERTLKDAKTPYKIIWRDRKAYLFVKDAEEEA